MAFSNAEGCPPLYTRDQWLREVPFNVSTGQFMVELLPCDLSIIGFWICAGILVVSRILLGIMSLIVLHSVNMTRKQASPNKKKNSKKRRGLAPLFDLVNTMFVILLVGLSPVTTSTNGTSYVLFGLAFAPYFISSLFFIMKMIKNRRRIGAFGTSSDGIRVIRVPQPNFRIQDDKVLVVLLSLCWIGIFGSVITWSVGAIFYGFNLTAVRLGIGFFTLMTSTSQIVAFYESVKTAFELDVHLRGKIGASRQIQNVRFRLLRTAATFAPAWISSTTILICLSVGAFPFFWWIAYILLSMPVINASAAVAMFFKKARSKTKDDQRPNPWHSSTLPLNNNRIADSTVPNESGANVFESANPLEVGIAETSVLQLEPFLEKQEDTS